MKTVAVARGNIENGNLEKSDGIITCFRCGICCTGYQVHMELPEAHSLADHLGISWREFLENYTDPRWPGTESLLLCHQAGACIFLEQPEGSIFGLCRIHRFKPKVCQAWPASLYKKECRQGLSRFWDLKVNESLQIEGSPESLLCFQAFLESTG